MGVWWGWWLDGGSVYGAVDVPRFAQLWFFRACFVTLVPAIWTTIFFSISFRRQVCALPILIAPPFSLPTVSLLSARAEPGGTENIYSETFLETSLPLLTLLKTERSMYCLPAPSFFRSFSLSPTRARHVSDPKQKKRKERPIAFSTW